MAEPPPESSRTPPGSPLNEPTQPPEHSMEDSDPQGTRKRPRLDSGSRVSESLTIEGASLAPAAPASDMDVTPDPDINPAPNSNKMTINVKSLANMDPEPSQAPPAQPQGTDAQPRSLEPDAPSADNNVISLPSSPVQSPEIEVAELEDMDQEPNTSNWRPLEEALRDQAPPEVVQLDEMASLLDSFPVVHEKASARENLNKICHMIETGDPHDVTALTAVKLWMDDCVRNLGQLTPQSYTEDGDFWECLPSLIECLLRRGQELPIRDGGDPWTSLEELLMDYALITSHLIRLDHFLLGLELDEPDTPIPELLSQRYLQPLSWALSPPHSIPFYRALTEAYGPKPHELILHLRERLHESSIDFAKGLADLISDISKLIPRSPGLASILVIVFSLVNAILDCRPERQHAEEDAPIDETHDLPPDSSTVRLLYDTAWSLNVRYQEWITKKSSWLSSEMSEQMLRQLYRSWTFIYAREPGLVDQMSKDMAIKIVDEWTSEDKCQVLTWGWKLGVLKKHIMEGRMELRVNGVETMQSDLVHIWKTTVSNDPPGPPLLPFTEYLVNFIKENKLVDYLVGVDSHPQLISRSSNIVGFLIMTNTYTDLETDTIWKTVTESQDSPIVSEVLSMLIRTFYMQQTTSPALVYMCTKFLGLPLDRFDARMFEVCEALLNRMANKPLDHELNSAPLRLCVRLLRESTAADNLSVQQRKELQSFGRRHLAKFIDAGISEESRMDIYERCIQDIAGMNQFTAGSIQTLSALVPGHDRPEMRKLATDFDLSRLVINDLLHMVNDVNSDFSDAFTQHGLVSRISMLFRLVDMAPETITPELGQALWKEIFLSKKLGAHGYKTAWNDMVAALGRSFEQNVFLDRCIHEYLPNLTPRDYSPELLAFAKQSINYEVRFNPPSPAGENEVVSIPGMERIWTFILTAPPGTIEADATQFAIEVYLDHQIIRNSPCSAVQATHVAIANRCIDQLKSAATPLKLSERAATNGEDSMETDGANGDTSAEEIRFRRSLLFLHRLLHGLRARPRYNSPQGSPPSLPERPLKGSALELTWQSFDGNKSSGVNHLIIGDLSTVGELIERFTQLTGFSKFTAICGGQKLDLLDNASALVKDMKLLHSGLIILRKAPDAQEVWRDHGKESLTSVDVEVLKHFDEIYEFLALREDIASEVYDFLLVFPPPERVQKLVTSEENNDKVLFPFDKPYVAFYSFHALLICLREETATEFANQSLVKHSVELLVRFLTADELSERLTGDRTKLFLASMAVECLLSGLSASHSTPDDADLIREPMSLVKRLLCLIEMARSVPMTSPNDPSQKLLCASFSVLVQGSICESSFWNVVKQEVQFDQLITALLLEESRQLVRNEVSERIKLISSPRKGLKQVEKPVGEIDIESPVETPTRIDMLATVWSALVETIPQAPKHAFRSAEFFRLALWLFRSVAEKSPRDVIFSGYLKRWSEVMFSHRTEEFVGRETVDDLVLGLAHLLEMCLNLADAAGVELDNCDLAERILSTYLFPELSPETDAPIVPQIPVMHGETRQKLYNIVELLCKRSDVNYYRTMELLEDVVPRDYTYGSNWLYDRSMMLRAPNGYAGLRNLSNTCYLNSLMTQLFMNIEFRDFILNLKLAAPDSSQKLLSETQRLFAWMQDTWTKSVDPQDFVESIRTYDNDLIDISIQMDVDEFYNLLFDRWEAQVVDPENKRKFRSFFGGQLVQQIKSKECPHISERLEPFSAIQCDIKGKASLEESLQAYVEGEIMQGDNKYSCTACGRHVDAVKRACLKEVPDNLIFHLKRFDFDMVSMLRSKINDQFQFPERIDMMPYNVESLSDPGAHVEPDIFELVGVLVHTGTAESGHYYSYTRERPTAGAAASWVEFNDADVSSFNPLTIADQCFGGQTQSVQGMGGGQINKVWNAYMLFYQRVSKMESFKEVYKPLKRDCPVRASVPLHLSNHIAMENELFIRSYSLLDPSFAGFVYRLILRWSSTASGFPKLSDLGTFVVNLGLDTLEQLVARTKDHAGLDDISTELCDMITRSAHAAHRTLQWFCERDTSMRNLILRISNADARQKIIVVILGAVKSLKRWAIGSGLADDQQDVARNCVNLLLNRLLGLVGELWPALQTVPRVWEDYFGFLLQLAHCGPDVICILLENGFLVRCLHIVWLDQEDRKRLRNQYANYVRMLEKGRRFSYSSMLSLCAVLFSSIDLSLPAVSDEDARTLSPEGKFPLSMVESALVGAIDREGSLSVLMKILQQDNFNNAQAARKIVAAFLASEPAAGLLPHIVKTLEIGLRFSPADLCIPFLEAALAFCRHCHEQSEVIKVITHVAKGIDTINNSAAIEHLEFFTHLLTLTNDRAGLDSDWFTDNVRDRIADIAPTLLIDKDRVVRQGALDFTENLLFTLEREEMSGESRSENALIARELVSACVDKINQTFRSGVVRAESRLINGITSVIQKCLRTYFDESEEDQKTIQEVTAVLQDLQEVQVDVPDDLVSESDLPSPEDWEATSALASDSEMGLVGSP